MLEPHWHKKATISKDNALFSIGFLPRFHFLFCLGGESYPLRPVPLKPRQPMRLVRAAINGKPTGNHPIPRLSGKYSVVVF
jgi:hypothetical protein